MSGVRQVCAALRAWRFSKEEAFRLPGGSGLRLTTLLAGQAPSCHGHAL